MTESTLKACSEDPDECTIGEIIARSIATGDNALVVATEKDGELSALPFSFFKKAIYSRSISLHCAKTSMQSIVFLDT